MISSSSGHKVIKMELGDYSIDTVNTFVSEMVDLGYNTRPSVDGTIELQYLFLIRQNIPLTAYHT